MVMLLIIGLLVEGALGRGWFLALHFICGLGRQCAQWPALLVADVDAEDCKSLHELSKDCIKAGLQPQFSASELLTLAQRWHAFGFAESALTLLAELLKRPDRGRVDSTQLRSTLSTMAH